MDGEGGCGCGRRYYCDRWLQSQTTLWQAVMNRNYGGALADGDGERVGVTGVRAAGSEKWPGVTWALDGASEGKLHQGPK